MPEQTGVIRWEDPKPSARQRDGTPWSRYKTAAADLRSQPMRWGVIAEFPGKGRTSLASHIRKGAIDCFTPAGDFDAVARQVNGKTAIYARYVGDGQEVGSCADGEHFTLGGQCQKCGLPTESCGPPPPFVDPWSTPDSPPERIA